MGLILKPDWQMAVSESTISLQSGLGDGRLPMFSLSPLPALVLALLNGERSSEEVCDILSQSFHLDQSLAKTLVQFVIHRFRHLLVEKSQLEEKAESRVYDPLQFVRSNLKEPQRRAEAPLLLTWIVTTKCNRRCLYCYMDTQYSSHASDSTLAVEEIKKIIDEAYQIGTPTFRFSGGEPFLRPDIPDILEYLIQRGFDIEITTKATLSKGMVNRLKKIGLRRIRYSLDGSRPSIVDKMVGSKGFFLNAIDSIKLLKEANIAVDVSAVISKGNLADIPGLLALLDNLGADTITLTEYTPSLGRHHPSFELDENDRHRIGEFIQTNSQKLHIQIYSDLIPKRPASLACGENTGELFCPEGITSLSFLPDGRVTRCTTNLCNDERFILGDLRHQTIMEVWHSTRMLNLIYPPRDYYHETTCWDCDQFDRCNQQGRCYCFALMKSGVMFNQDKGCPNLYS